MTDLVYQTTGGLTVTRREATQAIDSAVESLLNQLDSRRGAFLSSAYEYPGRYKRWSMGFVNPPLELTTRDRVFSLVALNGRGRILLKLLLPALQAHPHLTSLSIAETRVDGAIIPPPVRFAEEERSRQASAFSVLRAIIGHFFSDEDPYLGLYGTFGFDLLHQVEGIERKMPRAEDQRDLVLFIPDRVTIVDHHAGRATVYSYDFKGGDLNTEGQSRETPDVDYRGLRKIPAQASEFPEGGYADIVRDALEYFKRGDLFEVVPSHTFFEKCEARPTDLFRTLRRINPSPYGFVFNLGGEYLVGASPEMFVRVEGRRVETCPISGTIARGKNAIEDARQIRTLLNSEKDESELTMCTDVDRNDKARVCQPGSVRVIGRRQIEMYSHLIHTVDHVEGTLREGCDALDAFLTHCWAVTVTGAPKRWAVEFIESNEKSPRRWYGGAVGKLGFDGGCNTGLTLRTIRLQDEIAEIRVGATLLFDSDPVAEEAETVLKAAASRRALATVGQISNNPPAAEQALASGKRVLMVDCEDSFVLTLGDYFRQTGAEVVTMRHSHALPVIADGGWDLVVMSPGPGRPEQFGVPDMIRQADEMDIPVFGVCLGLQGMVEAFGGELGQLPEPMHGKSSEVSCAADQSRLFQGLPDRFAVGRYHSLYAEPKVLPDGFRVTAQTDDGLIMAVEHKSRPIAGVQFHPESIMSLGDGVGPGIIRNVMKNLAR